MRKRLGVIALAAVIAAGTLPLGFALTLESRTLTSDVSTRSSAEHGPGALGASAVLIPTATAALVPGMAVPDAAKLFAAGTLLFGLAAALRRAV